MLAGRLARLAAGRRTDDGRLTTRRGGMGDDHKEKEGLKAGEGMAGPAASWRLNISDFHMPERPKEPPFVTRVFLRSHGTYGTPPELAPADPLICLHTQQLFHGCSIHSFRSAGRSIKWSVVSRVRVRSVSHLSW